MKKILYIISLFSFFSTYPVNIFNHANTYVRIGHFSWTAPKENRFNMYDLDELDYLTDMPIKGFVANVHPEERITYKFENLGPDANVFFENSYEPEWHVKVYTQESDNSPKIEVKPSSEAIKLTWD